MGCFLFQVLCFAARQTIVLLMGEEDGGQAGKGAAEGLCSEAQRGERSTEGGNVKACVRWRIHAGTFPMNSVCLFRTKGREGKKTWNVVQRMSAKQRLCKWYVKLHGNPPSWFSCICFMKCVMKYFLPNLLHRFGTRQRSRGWRRNSSGKSRRETLWLCCRRIRIQKHTKTLRKM